MYPNPPFKKQPQEFPGFEYKLDPAPDFGYKTYQGTGKLKDKVAIITGGDSGIGRAIAYTFACEGANIVISYLPEEERDAMEVIRAVEETGQKILGIPGDIQDEAHCQDIIDQTLNKFGKLDILVNNAAYQMAFKTLDEITEAQLDQTFRTNIYAMFFLTKAAWKHLPPGSVILNTSSIQAFNPSPLIMPYAATKAAIASFTKSMAKYAGESGIRVNGVAPGPIWSPLNPMAMPPDMVETFGQHTELGRPGQPIEVAKVFVFLASDDASYVTGHIYGVTGGDEMPM